MASIKLYFVLSPIFFILVCFKFTKNDYPAYRFIILFLLILLPIYKYSEFNNGIGRLDSFPSIIKKKNKTLINWKIDKKDCISVNQLVLILMKHLRRFIYHLFIIKK